MITAAALIFALSASAAPAEKYVVELRVIEGVPGSNTQQSVDPKLAAFAKDLRPLPFKQLKLVDSHTTALRSGERIQLEIPQPKGASARKRFMQVEAHGRQAGGKLRFQLSIDSLKFNTLVAVPDGGTIFVAVPHHDAGYGMLFAFTARSG